MTKIIEASLENLDEAAAQIEAMLPEDAVIFLRGDLASGKTTLTKALAEAKGCSSRVTSPTFSIQQVYDNGIAHYDLYQCPNEKFLAMGLLESLEAPGWHLVEWGDEALEKLLRSHGFNVAVIEITPKEGSRLYKVETDA
ncbi:tRNA (adenosine(37)-N6)-threonylcarbamoyltransferase complex ATPase subunit type 1 TsaE [Hydrogenimonas cancrithermarum]|uniref:tRNA threonylcarbamoyladenosine biosynthesis protein TsaE n=1 Tax=Hydrogenimonas cancrithermarum TaxID=2993563 RepID=A0ABN6WSX1_9BACT|nr:tRNA (adenosine(37)-N6)-threonylcarbamoyltransferase complex ATPase subunit type 1 TsaE [Hydrogenimonas cancrithermarum]BDY12086.1 tRNA (adenosine(37)-N6)-threonylcarbamoyltransferase complex ATPase subunit type 1 TsaE [Hydrogenimonas cancrithermarum]